MKLTVMGARYIAGNLLNAQATLPDGRIMDHTRFSPELQLAIKQGFGVGTVSDSDYQQRMNDKYLKRSKEASGEPQP